MLTKAQRDEILAAPTTSVELAGKLLGVGRCRAYESAKEGEIPTIRLGRALRVPTEPLREMLGLSPIAA